MLGSLAEYLVGNGYLAEGGRDRLLRWVGWRMIFRAAAAQMLGLRLAQPTAIDLVRSHLYWRGLKGS